MVIICGAFHVVVSLFCCDLLPCSSAEQAVFPVWDTLVNFLDGYGFSTLPTSISKDRCSTNRNALARGIECGIELEISIRPTNHRTEDITHRE